MTEPDRSRNSPAAPRRRPRNLLLIAAMVMVSSLIACWAGLSTWADYSVKAGERALARRDFQAARVHLANYLQVVPSSAWGHLLAAQAARRAGLLDEAEAHLNHCRHLGADPDTVAVQRALLIVQRGDLDPEPFLLDRVNQNDPAALQILEVLIEEYLRTYRLRDALHALNAYLERRRAELQALLARGLAWDRQFYHQDAVNDYRRAVALHPDSDEARLRLAEALLVAGTAAEAAEHFEYLRERQPVNPAVLLGLARCQRQLGRPEGARQLLDAVLAQDARHAAALTEHGKLALDEGKPAEAEGWLRQAVDAAPHDRLARYSLCQCLEALGKDEETRACRDRLAQMDADLKRVDQLSREVPKDPRNADLRHEMGVLFLRNGEEQEGLRWLHLALELDPRHRPAHQALADWYEQAGKPDLAARHRQLAGPAVTVPPAAP